MARNFKTAALIGASLIALTAGAAASPVCQVPAGLPATVQNLTATLITSHELPYTPQVKLVNLPDFCRVTGVAKPTGDSLINFELWIPMGAAYNGKYEQVGNGGFAGNIPYAALAEGIRRGYATAGTDDGSQTGGTSAFANGHPEKLTDYAYRALKQTTDAAKAIIANLTGAPPKYSYFHGCSDGGREALIEAQRYPKDFDGIIVGSPANYMTHQAAGFIADVQAQTSVPGSLIPGPLLPQLSKGVLAQCVGKDGGAPSDTFLTDPRICKPNLSVIGCQPGQPGPTCLTPPQMAAVQKIYDGPKDPVTMKPLFPGFDPGTESDPLDWPLWITGMPPFGKSILAQGMQQIAPNPPPPASALALQFLFGLGFLADFAVASPPLNIFTVNLHDVTMLLDTQLAALLNSTDPDLRPFLKHGGKIIQYAGWADAAVAPRQSIAYYMQVNTFLAQDAAAHNKPYSVADTQSFYRLFMAPGMAHCFGGPGPNAFGNFQNGPVVDAAHDVLKAMEAWVEKGKAPETIIATKFANDVPDGRVYSQRPMCVYPKFARYDGVGDARKPGSFACKDMFIKTPIGLTPKVRQTP